MNNELNLELGKIYILSGIPGVGKSYFLKDIPSEMIISSDNIRKTIQVPQLSVKNERVIEHISEESNAAVFSILKTLIREKARLGLTAFIDTTAISDKERKEYVDIIKEYHNNYEVIIFDKPFEIIKKQNESRKVFLDNYVLEKFNEKFQKDSKYPFRIVSDFSVKVNLQPLTIPDNVNLDVVSDVHGLLEELIQFIESLGYIVSDNQVIHPDNRKLLFLGDFIDRGPKSLETLEFIKKCVDSGHYAIIGNHENKLILSYQYLTNGKSIEGGLAGKQTLSELLKRSEKEQLALISFLKNLPFYYIYKEFVFVHANINYFNPFTIDRNTCIYGSVKRFEKYKKDTDFIYQRLFDFKENKYSLIRGHIEQISNQKNVLSLEEGQAFAGNLVILSFKDNSSEYFLNKFKVSFNYSKIKKNNLLKRFETLIDNKMVIKKTSADNFMSIYKYSKRVFFDNLWHEDKDLLKARGIVLDFAGNIIQHPFDKVFNYGENNTGINISNDLEIIAVEKLNGFLGNIGYNPYTKDLLITTTGSFDSDFVGYIKDFITPKLKGKLIQFFRKNPMTLSFEVIHKEDPHIIEYQEKDFGLHLIGARGLSENDFSKTEEELDIIGSMFGFRRANYFKTTLGELKKIVKESNLEGYMVRENSNRQETILKFKTPYYLVTKFVGRMGNNKIKFMFSNPKKFKQNVDEEFYDLIDIIVKRKTLEEYLTMENHDKIDFIRSLINSMRE